jgi:predicted MFS family arabinose efflux permease
MLSLELLASCLIYCASIGYGGAISALGAGLPELAANLNIPESVCGQLFAFRGAGYLFGSLISSKLGKQKLIPTYGIVALAIYLSGFSTALSALTTSFTLLKVALFFQGIGFSLIDVFGAVCLCELWGDRVQVRPSPRSLFPVLTTLCSLGFKFAAQPVPLVPSSGRYLSLT